MELEERLKGKKNGWLVEDLKSLQGLERRETRSLPRGGKLGPTKKTVGVVTRKRTAKQKNMRGWPISFRD